MVNIRDLVLPDPKQYVEKALALYERALSRKTGRIVFIVAELGGGKTDLLNALAQALYRAKAKPNFLAGFSGMANTVRKRWIGVNRIRFIGCVKLSHNRNQF